MADYVSKQMEKDIRWIPIEGRFLLIRPDTGSWLYLGSTEKDIISSYQKKKSLDSVVADYQYIDPSDIKALIKIYKDRIIGGEREEITDCPDCVLGRFPRHAVLKLTDACNLRCGYCYVEGGADKHSFMNFETGIRILEEYRRMHNGQRFIVLLHGGEPLLNFELIKKLVEYAEPFRAEVEFDIQTNATLITDEIAQYLHDHEIRTGVSIDGPHMVHNRARPYANECGSFDQTMRGIGLLRKHNVPFGVVSVLTNDVAVHIDEVFDFFVNNEIYTFTFSPVQKIGRGIERVYSEMNGQVIFDAFRHVMDRIIDHNRHCKHHEWINERWLKYMVRAVFEQTHGFMCMRTPCGAGRTTLGFAPNGDCYICEGFIGNQDFMICNVNNGSLKDDMLSSKAVWATEQRRMNNLIRCKACEWRGLCGGVCYSSDYNSGACGVEETEICQFYKLMIPYMIAKYAEDDNLPSLIDRKLTRNV